MIEKILKEINRLKNELDEYSALEALDYIESYINTLQEESGCEGNFTTKSEDLEEYYKKEFLPKEWFAKPGQRTISQFNFFTAQHFAEWQKQQMKETLKTEYEKGRFDMRDEMMKDAREADVVVDRIGEVVYLCPHISEKTFDKVKIIIVKEEQQ
jgi:hypothetical protein